MNRKTFLKIFSFGITAPFLPKPTFGEKLIENSFPIAKEVKIGDLTLKPNYSGIIISGFVDGRENSLRKYGKNP